jgi:hypothetical protein
MPPQQARRGGRPAAIGTRRRAGQQRQQGGSPPGCCCRLLAMPSGPPPFKCPATVLLCLLPFSHCPAPCACRTGPRGLRRLHPAARPSVCGRAGQGRRVWGDDGRFSGGRGCLRRTPQPTAVQSPVPVRSQPPGGRLPLPKNSRPLPLDPVNTAFFHAPRPVLHPLYPPPRKTNAHPHPPAHPRPRSATTAPSHSCWTAPIQTTRGWAAAPAPAASPAWTRRDAAAAATPPMRRQPEAACGRDGSPPCQKNILIAAACAEKGVCFTWPGTNKHGKEISRQHIGFNCSL